MKSTLWGSIVGGLILLASAMPALANQSFFANGVTTGSAASTSPAYMTPGTGMLIQFTASSTNSVLGIAVEYSQDGVDWYRNYVLDPNQVGTTTAPSILSTPFSTTWKFASSSLGGANVAANSNYSTAAIMIPTPFRYTRVVFSITGANGAVWAQLVPIKEQC